MAKTIEELRKELKETCEKTKTTHSGMQHLIDYYMTDLKWSEAEAIEYALNLFHNGTIERIRFFGKDGEEL
ncbi:MAG: hypothetical protein ACOX24_00160 [Christensenellales bacterium]|jgi:hypothetical protein